MLLLVLLLLLILLILILLILILLLLLILILILQLLPYPTTTPTPLQVTRAALERGEMVDSDIDHRLAKVGATIDNSYSYIMQNMQEYSIIYCNTIYDTIYNPI
jgi:O-antigen ligase